MYMENEHEKFIWNKRTSRLDFYYYFFYTVSGKVFYLFFLNTIKNKVQSRLPVLYNYKCEINFFH